jgi:TPP-dependent pyruvate/acetoin dehydrogenase alpha subunit
MDVVAVAVAARRALASVKEKSAPFLLECETYRFRAHSMFDAQLYRSREEIAAWRKQDPIQQLRSWAGQNGLIHHADIERIEAGIETEIAAAVAFAEAGTLEPVEDLDRFVYMEQAPA